MIQKLVDPEVAAASYQSLMGFSIEKFKEFLDNNSIPDLLTSLNQIEIFLQHFEQAVKQKRQLPPCLNDFYNVILQAIPSMYLCCLSAAMRFTPFNMVGLVQTVYCHIARILGTNLKHLPEILAISAKMACLEVQSNCELLKSITVTLEIFRETPCMDVDYWLKRDLAGLVEVVVGFVLRNEDPDVIRNLYTMLDRVLKYNRSYTTCIPSYLKIIDMGLDILGKFVEYRTSKAILEFISTAISLPNPEISTLYQNILLKLFGSL